MEMLGAIGGHAECWTLVAIEEQVACSSRHWTRAVATFNS
jgi:hypothetical protein